MHFQLVCVPIGHTEKRRLHWQCKCILLLYIAVISIVSPLRKKRLSHRWQQRLCAHWPPGEPDSPVCFGYLMPMILMMMIAMVMIWRWWCEPPALGATTKRLCFIIIRCSPWRTHYDTVCFISLCFFPNTSFRFLRNRSCTRIYYTFFLFGLWSLETAELDEHCSSRSKDIVVKSKLRKFH